MSLQLASRPASKLTRTKSTQKASGARRSGWTIGDEVVALREVGTLHQFSLPDPKAATTPDAQWVFGASRSADYRIDDETVSRAHAVLRRVDGRWRLADHRSKNGLRVDGVPQPSVRLEAGMVISLGAVRFVAESLSFIALRTFLSRLLGWSDAAAGSVDAALQELRLAQLRRDPLILIGEGDLAPIARDLHDYLLGDKAAFVTADPRRAHAEDETVRSTKNEPDLKKAVRVATGGTVFVRTERMPASFSTIAASLRAPAEPRVLVVVGGSRAPDMERLRFAGPIYLPALEDRAKEVDHIIAEYWQDTQQEFRVDMELASEDRTWIRVNSESVADIAKATRRLLALRVDGTVSGAARRLGMASVSLRRWMNKRLSQPGAREKSQGGSAIRRWIKSRSN